MTAAMLGPAVATMFDIRPVVVAMLTEPAIIANQMAHEIANVNARNALTGSLVTIGVPFLEVRARGEVPSAAAFAARADHLPQQGPSESDGLRECVV